MRRTAGFSLLEALIALAIATLTLTAVLGLQRQLVDGQRRMEAMLARSEQRQNVLALLKDLNPDYTPEGEILLPPRATVRWSSTPITQPRLSAGFPGGDGNFYVTLHRVAVEVIDESGAVVDSFEIERMGWLTEDEFAVQ